MDVCANLNESNRTMGKEVENVTLVPGKSERWVPSNKRIRLDQLVEVGYITLLEDFPREALAQFDDEIPSRNGFTTFGRVYPESAGKQLELATNASTSVVEIIKYWYRGQAYLNKLGRFLLQSSKDPALCKLFKKPPYTDTIPAVAQIVQRTLGLDGTTLGMHESYLASRAIDLKPDKAERAYGPVLMSHLITRLWSLAGGVHETSPNSNRLEFVGGAKLYTIRSDYASATTGNKPIINTRDESFADPQFYRRNHITSGDGGMWPWGEFMKFTTTSLVQRLVENGFDCRDVLLDDPVAAAKDCAMIGIIPGELNSRIRSLSVMVNGKPKNPLVVQLKLVQKCERMAETCYISPEERYALGEWRRICQSMLKDALDCGDYVEFIGKLLLGTEATSKPVRTKSGNEITMNLNDFETAWCNLDPATSIGIRTRNRIAAQRAILDLDLMPKERIIDDARAEALAWGQRNIDDWPVNIHVGWNHISTEVGTVKQLQPFDADPEPWRDLLERTQAHRVAA